MASLTFCWSFALAQSSSTLTNSVGVSAGNADASNRGNVQAVVFEGGGQQLPPAGMVAIPSHQAPSVFQYIANNFGMPAEITGLAIEVFYDQKCRPEEDVDGESSVVVEKGGSKLTRITITMHPTVEKMKRGDKPVKVRTDLSDERKRYRCLGIMTAVADKDALEKGQPVGFSVLTSDMRRTVRSTFRGVTGDIVVLSNADYWGGAIGVANDSSGISLGASLFNAAARLTSLAVAPGISGGSGVSSPVARSGLTALILMQVSDEDPKGVVIGLADVKRPFREIPVISPSNNGKKAEVEKR